MATVPTWFDGKVYMQNKLKSLQTNDPDGNWTYDKMINAFTEAGFIGEEGYYNHFEQYGSKADENLSPNSYFNAYEYAEFKAISYFTSEDAGSLQVSEKTVRDNLQYYTGQIQQAFVNAGMSSWEHYNKYGAVEKINPSNSFDESDYLDAKAAALNASEGVTTWTADTVRDAIIKAGMTPLTHYLEYAGTGDGEVAAGATFPVPTSEQVDASGSDSTTTFSLTTASSETVVGTSGNDLFKAILNTDADDANRGTLNLGDTIDGGEGGGDVLRITNVAAQALPAGVEVKNVEKVYWDTTTSVTVAANLMASKYDGVQELWQEDTTAGNGAGHFVGVTVAEGVAAGFKASGTTGNSVSAAMVVTVGDASQSTMDVILDGVGNGSALTVTGASTACQLETVNVTGTVAGNAAGDPGTLTIAGDAAANLTALTTLNLGLTGDVDLIVTAANLTALEKIDASASTGNIRADGATGVVIDETANNNVNLKEISLGSGSDMLSITIGADSNDQTVDLGAGDDKIWFGGNTTAAAKTITVTLGDGKDTVYAGDGGNAAVNLTAGIANDSQLAKQLITISDFDVTKDILDISTGATGLNNGGLALNATQLADLADTSQNATLTAALTSLATVLGGNNSAAVFNYGGDAYVYIDADEDGTLGATDGLIKLTGVDAAALSVDQGGHLVV